MDNKFVYYSVVDVADDKVFTEERLEKWRTHIFNCYKYVFRKIKNQIDVSSHTKLFINVSLLEEVLVDAVIGMRKITDSSFNYVEEPNAFKVVAYLTYWWLRHKPVSVYFPREYRLEEVKAIRDENMSDAEYQEKCQRLAWRLKHLNEVVAVQIAITYIFNFSREICDNKVCEQIKRQGEKNFPFENFDAMKEAVLDKLLYYLSYRTIAPKVIEHLLEAYTFHPAWELTGQHWSLVELESMP